MDFQFIDGSFFKQCADITFNLRRKGEKPDKHGCYHIHFSGIVGKYTYNALLTQFYHEVELMGNSKIPWANEFFCCGIVFSTDIENYI